MPLPAQRAQLGVGATTVTYLPDGHGIHPAAVLFPRTGDPVRADRPDDGGQVTLSFGAFLLRTGERNILVDLGMGAVDGSLPGIGHVKGGSLLTSLAAEGLAAEDIDTVVFTHLHPDHVGWTSAASPLPAGAPDPAPRGLAFPNARHCVAEAEWTYWTTGGGENGPDPRTVVEPLTGVIEFLSDAETVAPGVTVHATPGHTPGHLAVAVADPEDPGTERVLIVGDVLHCVAQVAEAELSFYSDVDPRQALAVRKQILASPRTILAAGHFADHVFGHVEHTASGMTWVPHLGGDGVPGQAPSGTVPSR